MKKTNILFSYLLAGGLLATASAGIIGGIKIYSKNNELGVYNIDIQSDDSFEIKDDKLVYANFRNSQGDRIASFENLENPTTILLDPKIKSEKRRFSAADFADWFADNYNRQTPIFELKIGAMKFVNEYWDALSPSEFVKYARWFTKNVSWGPDAITLEHFALKKGVTSSGNNLLLGQHSTKRKEETKIEFYPDSFFGSFPIYSNAAGKGNASDNLTYKIFQNPISKESLDKYFATIPTQQVLANYDKSKVVAGIPAIDLIENKEIYFYDLVKILKNSFSDNPEISKKLAELKNEENFFVFANKKQNLDLVKKKFQLAALMLLHEKEVQLPKNFQLNFPKDFARTRQIKLIKNLTPSLNVRLKHDENNIPKGEFLLELNQREIMPTNKTQETPEWQTNQGTSFRFSLNQKISSDRTALLVSEIATKINEEAEKIASKGFFDLYNINHPVGKTIGIYQETPENRVFLPINQEHPAAEAENEFLSEFDSNKWSIYEIITVKKLSNSRLEIGLVNKKQAGNTKKITFDLNLHDKNYSKHLKEFNSFKIAINWKNRIIPKIIQEIEVLKDGKNTTVYQLYGEVFDGLIDKVLNHRKTNGENLVGTYVDSEIDPKTGLKKYITKSGNYIGYSHSSRIPYIALLKASSPFFKTTGINYLKYVGAHEYGHHQTLNYAQDNSDPETSIVIGALSTNTGVGLQSFYNLDVLRSYLQARSSGLDLRKSSPDLQAQTNGIYPNFSFDRDNKFEDESNIYGSKENETIDKLLSKKTRRFLQTINGLKNAADLRKLKLYDLFLLNSIDVESGTINPSIAAESKFFRNDWQRNENKRKSGFIKSSDISGLFTNSLVDGKGNLLEFDRLGKVKVADFKESDDRKTFSDLIVKIFFDNGKPAIDPSSFKDPSSLAELKEKIEQIQSAFSANLVTKFENNGWNSNSKGFTRFQPSSALFETSLSAILSNDAEKQGFYGTIIGNKFENSTVEIKLPEQLFDGQHILTAVKGLIKDPESIQLGEQLVQKQKEKKLLNFTTFFNAIINNQGSGSNKNSTQPAKIFEKLFKPTISPNESNLFSSLKSITNFNDSLIRRISVAIDLLGQIYGIYFDWAIKQLSPKNEENRTTQPQSAAPKKTDEDNKSKTTLKGYWTFILKEIMWNNLDKIFIFKDENNKENIPRYLFATIQRFHRLSPGFINENFLNLTNGPIFASNYLGRLISINGNEYFQNPKYNFYASFNSSNGKHDLILDQTEFDIKKDLADRWTSPFGNLIKFNKVITKNATQKLNPFFGIAQDFKFKNISESELDTSKIYLDAWDKTVFGFDYKNNYFGYQNQQNETEFSNLADFLEFVSIDPFALKIVKNNDQFIRNWDLDYVNTKFNLYKYAYDNLQKDKYTPKTNKNNQLTWNKKAKCNEIIEKLLTNFDISKEKLEENLQKYANFLMEAFEKSTLNLLIKNSKIENKNIDHLFLSSVGFMGFKNFARKTRDNLPATKFGKLTNLDRIKNAETPWLNFGSFQENNSLVFDNETFLNDDLKNSNKSEVYKWILEFLKEKNIKFKDIDLFRLQYLVGTKIFIDYTYQDINNQIQRMNTDLELSWLRSKNLARNETQPDNFFSNYVYNFPESLTRDFVQIHYSPSSENLDNISPLFRNISEANTGNEYFVDSIYTRKWIKNFIPAFDITQAYSQTLYSQFSNYFLTNFVISQNKENLDKLYENLTNALQTAQNKNLYQKVNEISAKEKNEIEKIIATSEKPEKFIDKILQEIENKKKINEISNLYRKQKNELFSEIIIEINQIMKNFKGELGNYSNYYGSNIQPVVGNNTWRNGYINKNVAENNGFFKDRFQRKVLDWELYDDNLEPVIDPNIRITNLKGEKVNNRAEAFWYYSLKSQGVGSRTVSGIWRDSKQDKVAFWGFLRNQDADKVHYLTFEDEITKQKYHVHLIKQGTNNIFYLKRQADLSTKWTLENEGYKSWLSSWSIIGEFKNALLRPGISGLRKFRIYFSDEKKQEIKGLFTLGSSKFIAENGKNYQLAPTYIEKNKNENYLIIRPQFK
ncbi:PDxFFG protein [Mycoplasma sp. MF12]|nr:PDxFFG protein [Mycoplasma sp. MF12]